MASIHFVTLGTMKILAFGLLLIGFAVSGYLLFRSFELSSPNNEPGTDVCSSVFQTSCDETLQNRMSHQLGIPLAGWGLVYYGSLATLLMLGWSLGSSFENEATLTAFVMSSFAGLASVALLVTMLVGIVPFCPLCGVVHVVNFLLLGVVVRLTKRSPFRLPKALVVTARALLSSKGDSSAEGAWKLVGLLIAPLVGLILYQWVMIQESSHASSNDARALQALSEFQSSPTHQIPIDTSDPQIGSADGPIVMVVFSDLRCPSCRRFSITMQKLGKEFENKLLTVFKHFPLETTCNTQIRKDLHPGACQAAWGAEAARRQGLFWEFHNEVFGENFGRENEALKRIASNSQLDVQQFKLDMADESVKQKIEADVELGIRLGVNSTPAVFLDGRRVHDTQLDVLRSLIIQQIARPSK